MINKEIIKLSRDSYELRKLASNSKVPFNKSIEIRKEQDKMWKKLQILKAISNRGE